ncbi:MAG: hypothetical protein AAF721_13305, partial [Myxococcota bacterium]
MALRNEQTRVHGRVVEILRAGDHGPLAIFAHANGFPPGAYAPFLEALGQSMRVVAAPLRPLWAGGEPAPDLAWADLGADLVELVQAM